MGREIIDKYNKIIEGLFIAFSVILIYMLLCHLWILSIIYAVLMFIGYKDIKKKTNKIQQDYEKSIK